MTAATMPLLAPAYPEIFLAIASMAMLMLGVFRGDGSSRLVAWASVLVLAVTIVLVVMQPAATAVTFGGLFISDAFGRFEFLARHGALGRDLVRVASAHDLRFRVYAAAPWPQGSARVFESAQDLAGSFDEVRRRGVWWELGRRHELPAELDFVCSPELGAEASRLFAALLPLNA